MISNRVGGAVLSDVRFGVLGPVWARRNDIELAVGQPRQQAVLAMLLLAERRVVTPAELVDGVWGDNPPSRATAAVRNYAYRLRRAIEPDPATPQLLRSVGRGYVLDVAAESLDVTLFEQRAGAAWQYRADGEVERAADLLHEALALFGGEPLTGVPGPYAQAHRTRLTERRLNILEERLDADLDAGRHATVAAELAGLVAEFPLRERLLGLRIRALYGCGQQTEALEAYADGRRRLIAELGVEPGPQLRVLHQQVLSGKDIPDRSDSRPEPVVPRQREPRPSQLPAVVADFTGRDTIAGRVRATLVGGAEFAVPIAAVTGLGGVGKTTLAVRVAHEVKDQFPDGQLYVDLHGADEEPAYPETVLKSFLRAFGMAEHIIPGELDERAALLRSVLADRRVLLVLDDARDVRQIRPLLPGVPGCAVLITSRSRLTSLPGARLFELPVFETREALTLLDKIAGHEAVMAEPEAARAVIEACGRLPLAVRISAARLASRPNWTLALLAERLADRHYRLDELRVGEVAVSSTFQVGYDQLEPELARAFRLLSVSRLHRFSRYSAAAMLDRSPRDAERLCEQLLDLSLLESDGAGRYRYHDLLRLFASEQAAGTEPSVDRVDALTRLLDFHLTVAVTTIACGLANNAIPISLADVTYLGMPLADMSAARTWLTTTAPTEPAADALYRLVQGVELDSIAGLAEAAGNLLCTVSDDGAPADTWRAGTPLLPPEHRSSLEAGLARTRFLHEPSDQRLRAQIAFVAATAATLWERVDEARAGYDQVRTLCGEIGDIRGEVLGTAGLGRTMALLGDFDSAYALGLRARNLAREHQDLHAEAFAVHGFGQIARMRGDDERSAELRADTIQLWFATKQPVPGQTAWLPDGVFDWSHPQTGVGAWLGVLGHALADLDRGEQARICWQRAITILAGSDVDTMELRSLVTADPADQT